MTDTVTSLYYAVVRGRQPGVEGQGPGRRKDMIKTYRIELKNRNNGKIEIGRTMFGVDISEIVKEFFRIAENEIGAERIARCDMKLYEA